MMCLCGSDLGHSSKHYRNASAIVRMFLKLKAGPGVPPDLIVTLRLVGFEFAGLVFIRLFVIHLPGSYMRNRFECCGLLSGAKTLRTQTDRMLNRIPD